MQMVICLDHFLRRDKLLEFDRLFTRPTGQEIGQGRKHKVFRLPTGERKLFYASTRLHYQDSGWQDVDIEPRQVGSTFVVDKAPYIATLDGLDLTYESRVGGRIELELQGIGGGPLSINPQLQMDRILFPEIRPNVDVELVFRANGLRWQKTLKTPAANREFTWRFRPDPVFQGVADMQTVGRDAENRRTEIDRSENVVGPDRVITETFTGRVSNIVDDSSRRRAFLANPTFPVQAVVQNFPVVLDPDFTETVQDAADVVNSFEYNGGANGFYTGVTFIYCGVGGGGTGYFLGGGVIFETLDIDNAETVTLADFKIDVDSINGTPASTCKVKAWDTDNPTAFSSTNRPKNLDQAGSTTTAEIDVSGVSLGANTINVTSVIQELVDRGGWANGNNVALVTVDEAASASGTNNWRADGWNQAGEPTLEITLAAVGGVKASPLLLMGAGP